MRKILTNCLVAAGSVLITLVLLNFGIQLFLPVTEFPRAVYDPEIGLHHGPNQTGLWAIGATSEVAAHYHINAQGWNSMHNYQEDKPAGVYRVAVIGDSFVEGLEVDPGQGFPALLEKRLGSAPSCLSGKTIQVYPFGFTGSPLSQYLQVMRVVSSKYHPDLIIVMTFSNDFDESLSEWSNGESAFGSLRQTNPDAFLSFREDTPGHFVEAPPAPYEPSPLRTTILSPALTRYLLGNLRLNATLPELLAGRDPNARPTAYPDDTPYSAATLSALTDHIVGQMRVVADRAHVPVLLFMVPDYDAIYAGEAPGAQHRAQSRWVAGSAARAGIEFIDLHDTFAADYQQNHRRFTPTVDFHWNPYGHARIADVLEPAVIDTACPSGAP